MWKHHKQPHRFYVNWIPWWQDSTNRFQVWLEKQMACWIIPTTLTANLASLDVQGTLNKVKTRLWRVLIGLLRSWNSNQGSLSCWWTIPNCTTIWRQPWSHADSLVIDLKAHPKRYVHFSVFGRKDKQKEFELNKFSLNKIRYVSAPWNDSQTVCLLAVSGTLQYCFTDFSLLYLYFDKVFGIQ